MDDQQSKMELDAVYRSLSWRITMPLRELSALIQGKQSLLMFLKRALKFFLRRLMRVKLIGKLIFIALSPFPEWRARLWERLFPAAPEPVVVEMIEVAEIVEVKPVRDVKLELSPNAYHVYASLLVAMNNKN